MQGNHRFAGYVSALQRRPNAWAILEGSAGYPGIRGQGSEPEKIDEIRFQRLLRNL